MLTTDPTDFNPQNFTGDAFTKNETLVTPGRLLQLPVGVPIQITSSITLTDGGTFEGQMVSTIDPFFELAPESANDFTLSISPLDFAVTAPEVQPVVLTVALCFLAIFVARKTRSEARS